MVRAFRTTITVDVTGIATYVENVIGDIDKDLTFYLNCSTCSKGYYDGTISSSKIGRQNWIF